MSFTCQSMIYYKCPSLFIEFIFRAKQYLIGRQKAAGSPQIPELN